jgi:hypothetical protein
MTCPQGGYITSFSVRASDRWLVAIQAACSDGYILGPVGGSDGIAKGPYCNDKGFVWSTVAECFYHPNEVGFIISANNTPTMMVGAGGYNCFSERYDCPSGQVFVGITGTAVDSVRKLGFTCGWTKDTAAPQVRPSPFTPEDLW